MVLYQVNGSGVCNTCQNQANEGEVLQCYDCKSNFHSPCGENTPYGSKTFVSNFKKVKVANFLFVCDVCLTKREHKEASTLKDQISALTETVNSLVKDQIIPLTNTVQNLVEEANSVKKQKSNVEEKRNKTKKENSDEAENKMKDNKWSDVVKTKQTKSSLCIKSNGAAVNMKKVEELAIENSIQVSRTVVKDNGDVHVHLPSNEVREKFTPLLNDQAFAANEVYELKSKLPTVSVLNVKEFTSNEDFVNKIKKQNPKLKELLDNGSEFTIVYTRESKSDDDQQGHQVVARVSDDIRKAMKESHNKIYIDLNSYKVIDWFYIKRCNRCQNFGHYGKDCTNEVCCGYCGQQHQSETCEEVEPKDFKNYHCNNCREKGVCAKGHSTLWNRCPTYLDLQNKLRKSIPYYQKN